MAPRLTPLEARNNVAHQTRRHGKNSSQVLTARAELAEANIQAYVQRVLAQAPPLTDEQRTRLAELLRPVRRGGDAA